VQKEIDTLYSDPAVLASYQILSHIGKGSYAVVSSAIEKSTQRNFAIKIYERMAIRDPQRLENVKR
jgi:serine/threonine protein kinase